MILGVCFSALIMILGGCFNNQVLSTVQFGL